MATGLLSRTGGGMGAAGRPGVQDARWLLFCLAIGCTPIDEEWRLSSEQQPITNGAPVSGDLGVVGLVSDDFVFCSGTLIAPRVVVTAAHCLEDDELGEMEVLFGTEREPERARRIGVLDSRTHPDYRPRTLDNDLALLLLEAPAPLQATAWPLLATPLTENNLDGPLRIVGYGIDAPNGSGDETPDKREGFTTLDDFTETTLIFGPNPSQTCLGDSGGPIFITVYGVEYLVGVASAGDSQCQDHAVNARVDAFYEDFILPYILSTAEGSADTGESCYYHGNCAAGQCYSLEDEIAGYCTNTCSSSSDCPSGMECARVRSGEELCLRVGEPVQGTCSAGGGTGTGAWPLLLLVAFRCRKRRRRDSLRLAGRR